jgi:glycosyltransferase involved in cell wall biosynthesis
MIRVKTEAQFLRASVESILPLVDEVVIVDNASTDATAAIANELAALVEDPNSLIHEAKSFTCTIRKGRLREGAGA